MRGEVVERAWEPGPAVQAIVGQPDKLLPEAHQPGLPGPQSSGPSVVPTDGILPHAARAGALQGRASGSARESSHPVPRRDRTKVVDDVVSAGNFPTSSGKAESCEGACGPPFAFVASRWSWWGRCLDPG